jgi:hypothetical protein
MTIAAAQVPAAVPHTPAPLFSWRRELALWFAMVLAWTIPHLLIGWYNGRGPRPLLIAGFVLWVSSIMAMGAHRRWKAARSGRSVDKRWRFSTAELFLIVTGIVAWVGFAAADHRDSLHVYRQREKFSALAAPILGPEGRLGFDSHGDISITICDRSFDDDRLGRLAELIRRKDADANVRSLMFGSGTRTAGTPPRWPGVTDRSVDCILRWKQLEWLFIEGTAITRSKHEDLLELPALHEASRTSLQP